MTNTVRVPSPAPGTGYRVIRGTDGRMTTVPLTGADHGHVAAATDAPISRRMSGVTSRQPNGRLLTLIWQQRRRQRRLHRSRAPS
jgi:hypothetical protein